MRRSGGQTVERTKRSGSVAFEMLLILPVFLVLLLGFVELSTIVVVEERLAAASAQGARVASQGGSTTDVQTAVNNSLGSGTIQSNLQPIKYYVNNAPAAFDPANPTIIPALSGDAITVRLEVQAKKTVPNLLRFIGYSISNQMLVGQTVMRKE